MSSSHYVKPATSVYGPGCLVTVVAVGRPVAGTGRNGIEEFEWDHGAGAVCRFRAGKWSPISTSLFSEGEELIEWAESQSQPNKGTWVIAPNASYALTLAGMFPRWDRLGVKWRSRRHRAAGAAPTPTTPVTAPVESQTGPADAYSNSATDATNYIVATCITRGNPTIVRYSIGERRVCWVSGEQYFPSTEDGLRHLLFPSDPGDDPRPTAPGLTVGSALDRALLWMHAFRRLADWWRSIRGGPWGTTIGQLSLNYYRHRLAPRTLLSHQEPQAREIEERAIYGGRCQTWFFGAVGTLPRRAADKSTRPPAGRYDPLPGELEHWDVASMYPTILAREEFPEHYLYTDHRPPLAKLADAVRCRCCIADVTVRCDEPGYPFRDDDRVVWPVGEFRTALAGPELRRAVERGDVVECHRLITYRGGRPFAPAAKSLLLLRQKAKHVGDPVWESLVKALSNAFGGKLAQRRFEWVMQPTTIPLVSWGEWSEVGDNAEDRRVWRAAAGLVWERHDPKYKGRPLASCFAYLTAYGRNLMFELCRLIPRDQLISMDTDGVWVRSPSPELFTSVRMAALNRGYILRRTGGATGGVWYDPRHYWTSKGWVLSGYHEPRRVPRSMSFTDTQTHIPHAELCDGPPTRIHVHTRTTHLQLVAAQERVGPDGWHRPLRVAAPSRLEPPPVLSDLRGTLP